MKNKKLVLSVLSTTVVASMASSAFAAEQGIYIGGNVKHYYSIDSFFSSKNTSKIEDEADKAGLNHIVYVDDEGKAATLDELLNSGESALSDDLGAAFGDSLSDEFTSVKEDGNDGDKVVPSVDPVVGSHTPVVTNNSVTISGTASNADKVTVTISAKDNTDVEKTVDVTDGKFTVTFDSLQAGDYTYEVVASHGDDESSVKDGQFSVVATDLKVDSVSAIAGTKTVTLPGTNVPATASFEVKFSGEADKATVNTGTVFLTKDGVKQLTTVSFDETKKTATLALNAGTLEAGKTYVLTVEGVKGKDGKELTKATYSIGVADSPTVVSAQYSTTADDATGTLADVAGASVDGSAETVKFTFNKDMDVNTINTSTVKLFDLKNNKYIPATVTPSLTGVTVAPNGVTFEADAEYRITLGSSIADLAGNKLGEDYSVNFFYNATAVTLGASNPIDTAISVYNKITSSGGNDAFKWRVQFSGDVDATTVNGTTVTLKEKVTGASVAATVSYEAGSRYVILTPQADLKEMTDYLVTVDGVKTTRGIKVAKVERTFTTGDFTAPTITSTTPAHAADKVAVDAPFAVNFSEKMKLSTLTLGTNVVLKNVTDNSTVTITSWIGTLSEDGKTYTLKAPTGTKLDPNKTYELTISKNIEDANSNKLTADTKVVFNTAPAAATSVVDVRTGAFDSTGTVVASGSYKLANTSELFINFSQALKANAGTYKVEELVKVEKLNASTGTYSPVTVAAAAGVGTAGVSLVNGDKTIKVDNPTDNYAADTTYRVTVPTTVKDAFGNSVSAVEYVFTTGTKPSTDVAASYPTSFATSVSTTLPYVAIVIDDANSDLKSSNLTSDNVKFVKKSDGSAAPYTLAFAKYAKPGAETITVGGAADETAATTLTLADAQKDNVQVGDIITVAGTAQAFVVTAKAGDVITLDRAFGSDIAAGTALTRHQGVVYKLNTDAKLASNTEYQVQISGVQDAAGNPIDTENYTFRTATVASDIAVASTSIANGQTGVAVNAPIEITFNENVANVGGADAQATLVDAAGIDGIDPEKRIALETAAGVVVPGKVVVDGKKLTIVPDGFLAADTVYKVTVDNTVAGSTGTPLSATTDYSFTFQTEQTATVTPAIQTAVYFDANGSGTINDGDVIRLTFNTVLNNTNLNAVDDFAITGLAGDSLGTSAVAYTAGNKYVDITLAGAQLNLGVTSIAISKTGATVAVWTDGVGNAVSTDAVKITK